MIDTENVFQMLNGMSALMCARDADTGDLVRAARDAIDNNVRQISVDASAVSVIWPWIENTNIEIAARITLKLDGETDACISDLSARVKKVFKQGAAAAQIFVRCEDLAMFADAIAPIRDDLFFNRNFSIALDLAECAGNWGAVFDALSSARADSVLLTLTRDAGDKSYFVGWIYELAGFEHPWRGALHFALGKNPIRIEQVQRLMRATKKEALAKMLFFVNN